MEKENVNWVWNLLTKSMPNGVLPLGYKNTYTSEAKTS